MSGPERIVRSKCPRAVIPRWVTDSDLADAVNDPDRYDLSVDGQVWKILGLARYRDPASAVLLEVWFVESGDVAFVFFGDEASAEGLDLWMSE